MLEITPNSPALWRAAWPQPAPDTHKYLRGHALVLGGPLHSTGAARIAARCALRIGAGLVSVLCETSSLPVYASALEAVMTKCADTPADIETLIAEARSSAVLIGPGAGLCARTRHAVECSLRTQKPTVLDADALSVFAEEPNALFFAIESPTILTPHEGEFVRLFGPSDASRAQRAHAAAQRSGAVIVLKGHHTIIAAPDGRMAQQMDDTPYLATAGSGDALAGMCVGLLAQGMPAFEAACAAVWLHASIGLQAGMGLIAEDMERHLPAALHALFPAEAHA